MRTIKTDILGYIEMDCEIHFELEYPHGFLIDGIELFIPAATRDPRVFIDFSELSVDQQDAILSQVVDHVNAEAEWNEEILNSEP